MDNAVSDTLDIQVKGRATTVPAVMVGGMAVITTRRFPRIGQIFDERWLPSEQLPPAAPLIAELRTRKGRPDIFTFAQRVPAVEPAYDYYYELDNHAVLPVSTYDEWFRRQIPGNTRTKIRASEKRGVVVRVSEHDDDYVNGIVAINNETPLRGGRRFWHFGKSFEKVKLESRTYAERGTYLAAYHGNEMSGYLKMVWDTNTVEIMQLLSKMSARDLQPNNALLAEAVRQCDLRKVGYLLYGAFDYLGKVGDPLTNFKKSNGFFRMDVPRYYVPLTTTGALALRLGLHKKLVEMVPEGIAAPLRALRSTWHVRLTSSPTTGSRHDANKPAS